MLASSTFGQRSDSAAESKSRAFATEATGVTSRIGAQEAIGAVSARLPPDRIVFVPDARP
ncbi:hypothetical protein TNCT6_55370 [Streptomyces sp. 6-11-2]|nr:hypothetical protein TNCT6_55370 [Streptomyces sp. 6-11-2]